MAGRTATLGDYLHPRPTDCLAAGAAFPQMDADVTAESTIEFLNAVRAWWYSAARGLSLTDPHAAFRALGAAKDAEESVDRIRAVATKPVPAVCKRVVPLDALSR